MAWRELTLDVARRDFDLVSAALFAVGAAGVQEDYRPGEAPPPRQPWDTGPVPPPPHRLHLRAWLEDPDAAAVEAALARHLAGGTALVGWSDVPDTDWEAESRARFVPVVVSERIVVAPPWDAPEGAVIIEPGQGFGSGDHPTTLAALRHLDRYADTSRRVLDVGCGSGILAIVAAKLGLEAEGFDIDPVAVADATRQAAANGVDVRFTADPISAYGPADLVLANLYAEVLVALADELVRVTEHRLVLAGILADRERLVTDRLSHDLVLVDRVVDGEWVSQVWERR